MPHLYIDVETLPDQSSSALETAKEGVKPPGTYKKPESIAGWWAAEGEAAIEQAWRKTALDGTYGELAMVSYAVDDGPISTHIRGKGRKAERALLQELWRGVESSIKQALSSEFAVVPEFVGHNATFDLRFLYQRSMIRRVRPSVEIPYNAAPWAGGYYDTMYAWAGQRGAISLDNLAKALRVKNPYKGDITGATVWDAWAEGRKEELMEYNRADVAMTRDIHRILAVLGKAPRLADR